MNIKKQILLTGILCVGLIFAKAFAGESGLQFSRSEVSSSIDRLVSMGTFTKEEGEKAKLKLRESSDQDLKQIQDQAHQYVESKGGAQNFDLSKIKEQTEQLKKMMEESQRSPSSN